MTKEEMCLIAGFVLFLLAFILSSINIWASGGPSHVGATEPSKLPPPPEPKAYGPLFLHIQFYYHVGISRRPDIYLRADDIKSVIGDCRNSILTIENGMEELKFEDVEQYSFVKMSQMGDFLFEEEL